MHHVIARLDALDPDAGAAARVITRFDELVEGRAGLEPIVAAVATLTGCPARFVDSRHNIALRADVDGHIDRKLGPTDAQWPTAQLTPDDPAAFWIEHTGGYSLVEAMVLDRASFAARGVLQRTRRAPRLAGDVDDPAAVEVLLDAAAGEHDRRNALRALRIPEDALLRAVAVAGAPGRVETVDQATHTRRQASGQRVGVGPAVPFLELPRSWADAQTALRFAADGTDDDPGPCVVYADEVSALALLAGAFDPAAPPIDVLKLETAAKTAPWVLRTLVEYTSHTSLRLAAAALYIHHSTLQDRLVTIEQSLGWSTRDPAGRLRVQLAIAIRRLRLHPAETGYVGKRPA